MGRHKKPLGQVILFVILCSGIPRIRVASFQNVFDFVPANKFSVQKSLKVNILREQKQKMSVIVVFVTESVSGDRQSESLVENERRSLNVAENLGLCPTVWLTGSHKQAVLCSEIDLIPRIESLYELF